YRQARSQQARFIAFPLALVVLYIIIKLATTKYRYWVSHEVVS
ncbi:putative transcriptional regulator, partial [Salmonella enterica subsp. enterica serovar Montevideo str. MB102109-0047]